MRISDWSSDVCSSDLGATFLDLATLADPDSPLPSTVPPATLISARMGAMGIGDASRVVLYDDSPLRSAARAWWLMRLFGKGEVAIPDGGLATWRAENSPSDAGRSPMGEPPFCPKHKLGRSSCRDRWC